MRWSKRRRPLFRTHEEFLLAHSNEGRHIPCRVCDRRGYRWTFGHDDRQLFPPHDNSIIGFLAAHSPDSEIYRYLTDPDRPWFVSEFEDAHWPASPNEVAASWDPPEPLFGSHAEFEKAHSPGGEHMPCRVCDARGYRWTYGRDPIVLGHFATDDEADAFWGSL